MICTPNVTRAVPCLRPPFDPSPVVSGPPTPVSPSPVVAGSRTPRTWSGEGWWGWGGGRRTGSTSGRLCNTDLGEVQPQKNPQKKPTQKKKKKRRVFPLRVYGSPVSRSRYPPDTAPGRVGPEGCRRSVREKGRWQNLPELNNILWELPRPRKPLGPCYPYFVRKFGRLTSDLNDRPGLP